MTSYPYSTLTGLLSIDHQIWKAGEGEPAGLLDHVRRKSPRGYEAEALACFLDNHRFGHLSPTEHGGRPTKSQIDTLRRWETIDKPRIIASLREGYLDEVGESALAHALTNLRITSKSKRGRPSVPGQRATNADIRLRRAEFDYRQIMERGETIGDTQPMRRENDMTADDVLQMVADRHSCHFSALKDFIRGASSTRHR